MVWHKPITSVVMILSARSNCCGLSVPSMPPHCWISTIWWWSPTFATLNVITSVPRMFLIGRWCRLASPPSVHLPWWLTHHAFAAVEVLDLFMLLCDDFHHNASLHLRWCPSQCKLSAVVGKGWFWLRSWALAWTRPLDMLVLLICLGTWFRNFFGLLLGRINVFDDLNELEILVLTIPWRWREKNHLSHVNL